MAQEYSKKITLLVVLVSILSTSLLGQNRQDSKKYKREVIYFIKFITQTVLKNKNELVINDVLSNKRPFNACAYCLNTPNFGDSIFNKKEIAMTYKKMVDTTVKYKLSSVIGNQVHLYNSNGIYLKSVIQFSNPIFLRHFKYCVFAYSIPFATEYESGGFTPESFVILCKKQGKKWQLVRNIGHTPIID